MSNEKLLINDSKSNNSEDMRTKQVEEMAKALTKYEYSLCERLPKDKCLLTSAIHAQVSCDYCKIAEFLYNAGYRKQSEGEWEYIATHDCFSCSICKFDSDVTMKYCGGCGAKMKGCAE